MNYMRARKLDGIQKTKVLDKIIIDSWNNDCHFSLISKVIETVDE